MFFQPPYQVGTLAHQTGVGYGTGGRPIAKFKPFMSESPTPPGKVTYPVTNCWLEDGFPFEMVPF